MDKDDVTFDKLISRLEANGELIAVEGAEEFFIQAVDDKEGYEYVSSTNEEFANSRDAVQWLMERVRSWDSIQEFE